MAVNLADRGSFKTPPPPGPAGFASKEMRTRSSGIHDQGRDVCDSVCDSEGLRRRPPWFLDDAQLCRSVRRVSVKSLEPRERREAGENALLIHWGLRPLKAPPGHGSLPLVQGGRPRGWAEPQEDGTHLAFDTPKRLPDRTPCSLVFLTPRGPEQAGDPRSAAWPTPQWAASHCDRPPATHRAPSNPRDHGHLCG